MIGFASTIGLFFVLWLSHRVYRAYLSTVAREERRLRKLSQVEIQSRSLKPLNHLGPRLFFALDIALLGSAVFALRSWLPFFEIENAFSVQAGAECLILGSGVIGVGMVSEGRLWQSFYQRMIRSVRTLRRGRAEMAFEDQIFGQNKHDGRRLFLGAVLSWAALPLLLTFFNIHLISETTSTMDALALAGAYFVLPQLALGAYLISVVRKVRYSLYH